MLQLRRGAFYVSAFALLAVGAVEGYRSLQKCRDWAVNETLVHTAAAGYRVKNILVTGRHEIPAEELLTRLSIKQDAPIFNIDIAEAQKALEGISWVKSVSVSRRLPDTVIVAIEERKPIALWQYQQKISLIDNEGHVLTSENLDAWSHLPLVVGAGAEKEVSDLIGMLGAEPAIAANVVSAVRIEGRRWDLHMKNDVTVKLPEQDMELALRHMAILDERKNLFGRNISAIDLRQPEHMIVTPIAAEATDKPNATKKTKT